MHAPKNADVSKLIIEFRARFNTNADYDLAGVGCATTINNDFNPGGSQECIQVTRNTGSRDGTTFSQSSGGSANGSFHNFRVEWDGTQVILFVDDTSTITKTSNLPTRPMVPYIYAQNNTNTIDVIDYGWRWE